MKATTIYKILRKSSIYQKESGTELNAISFELALSFPKWISYGQDSVVINDDNDDSLEEAFLELKKYPSIASLNILLQDESFRIKDGLSSEGCGTATFFLDNPFGGLVHQIWLSQNPYNQLLLELNNNHQPREIRFTFNENLLVNKNSGFEFAYVGETQSSMIPIESFYFVNDYE